MAVKGDLKDLSLVNIIQVNCNERNQARLIVRHRGKEAVIFFEDGNIVHTVLSYRKIAEARVVTWRITGEEVIYELLTWENGEFELEQDVPPPRHTLTADWSGLLLEGMRRIDEGTAKWEVEWDEVEVEDTGFDHEQWNQSSGPQGR